MNDIQEVMDRYPIGSRVRHHSGIATEVTGYNVRADGIYLHLGGLFTGPGSVLLPNDEWVPIRTEWVSGNVKVRQHETPPDDVLDVYLGSGIWRFTKSDANDLYGALGLWVQDGRP